MGWRRVRSACDSVGPTRASGSARCCDNWAPMTRAVRHTLDAHAIERAWRYCDPLNEMSPNSARTVLRVLSESLMTATNFTLGGSSLKARLKSS